MTFKSSQVKYIYISLFTIEGMRVASPSSGVPAVPHSEWQKD